ncbi:M48 family metalloprotease [Marinobacterium jannaschii]|uniref:M48 family metalloprotease n=1 Tax=Marinobacterium jannaschii TaxID=64970 RepID=UPI000B0C7BF2|nr:M48 family metalloprotease [Marinobacterium jannaschii]
MMRKLALACVAVFALGGCVESGSVKNIDATLGAATDLVRAVTLNDEQAKALALQASQESDSKNKVAAESSDYHKRLARIVSGLHNEDGLQLNFKVYEDDSVNAFAMADGTVRVYSGLLDLMTDDEVRFVIGHEIGHVKQGHSRKAMQVAYAASAARKGAVATGSTIAALAASEIGAFTQAVVNAQFSQAQELRADKYAVKFMRRHDYNLNAALSAMGKMQALDQGGSHSLLSSHPPSSTRAERIEDML